MTISKEENNLDFNCCDRYPKRME